MSPVKFNQSVLDRLSKKVKNLKWQYQGSRVEKAVAQVQAELDQQKIDFKIRCWASDDWYTPDGQVGFAFPFYLLDPKLSSIATAMDVNVEGRTQTELVKLIRHEVGHTLDNAFCLRKKAGRKKLFGAQIKYPLSYSPKYQRSAYVDHLGDGYAESHPDEDFAETFSVWLGQCDIWKTKYQSRSQAYAKLKQVDQWMTDLKNQKPINNRVKAEDLASKDGRSLKEVFLKRASNEIKYARKIFSEFTQELDPSQCESLHRWLRKNKKRCIHQVATYTGHSIDQVSRISRCFESEALHIKGKKQRLSLLDQEQFLDHLTLTCLESQRRGFHRIKL